MQAASPKSLLKLKSARSTKAPSPSCSTLVPWSTCLPGKDGLLHISQIAHERVDKVSDYLTEGQIVKVKVHGNRRKGPCQAVHEGAARSVLKACLSALSVAERGDRGDRVATAAPVVIVAIAVIVVIAPPVAIALTVHPVPSNNPPSKARVVPLRTSNHSSSERHEETGRWQLEDAR
jgi:hypothetical protein